MAAQHRGKSSKRNHRKRPNSGPGRQQSIKKSLPSKNASSLEVQRQSLPIYSSRQKIVDTLRTAKSGVLIIVGATGSGKSTQLPQYLLDLVPSGATRSLVERRQCVASPSPGVLPR